MLLPKMRLFCVHVLIVLLIRNFCVSQFHQDNYDIVHDRIEILDVNKSVVPTLILTVFKYNDTLKMKAINLTADFRSGLRKNLLLHFAAFKKVQKVYRLLPIPNITLDICDEYRMLGERNPFGIRTAISKTNFHGCPVAPGMYYMDSWVVEQEKFPPHFPPGDFKISVHAMIDDDIFAAQIEWYGSLIKKNKNKKKH